jgi:hypothetical protein
MSISDTCLEKMVDDRPIIYFSNLAINDYCLSCYLKYIYELAVLNIKTYVSNDYMYIVPIILHNEQTIFISQFFIYYLQIIQMQNFTNFCR